MTKPMRRIAAIVATAAMSVALSACTQGHWVYSAPPAAGVQADDGGVKLRNFLIIADTEGKGMLLGAVATRDADIAVEGFTVTPGLDDGSYGKPVTVDFSEEVRKGATIYIDGETTQFSSPDLTPGMLADVDVTFADGTVVKLDVPVMPSDHPDYQEWWDKYAA